MSYRKGQQFVCPHCGQESVIKVEIEMDGWTKVGEYLACAMCKAKVEDVEQTAAPSAPKQTSKGAPGLMDFLGTTKEETGEVLDDDGERRFCKDCDHLLDHPFKIYCLLHKKDVNPMDDCGQFVRRKKK